jgi:hypothetical protein
LRRFAIDESDVGAVRIVECGLHSGFPLCCIMFYVKIWAPWNSTLPDVCEEANFNLTKMQSILRRINPALERASEQQWAYLEQFGNHGYVRCPSCILSGKVVKVKACDHLQGRFKSLRLEPDSSVSASDVRKEYRALKRAVRAASQRSR